MKSLNAIKIVVVLIIVANTILFSTSKTDNTTLKSIMKISNAAAEEEVKEPNYVYFEKLVASEIYNNVATFSCGTKILVSRIPVGISCNYSTGSEAVGSKYNCESPALGKCDQNKVRIEYNSIGNQTTVCCN